MPNNILPTKEVLNIIMKRLAIFCTFMLTGLLILGALPTHGEAEIYDSVVRLHVLANSDSAEDQALKLRVRDSVLERASAIVSGCRDRAEAVAALNGSLESLRRCALATVRDSGYDYNVTVLLDYEDYPTRSYEAVCFPAGEYMSLRVCIGEAEGQNWWCVLFPNLCYGAADRKSSENAFIQAGLTPEQYKIVTETGGTKYKLRFRLLELLEQAFGK